MLFIAVFAVSLGVVVTRPVFRGAASRSRVPVYIEALRDDSQEAISGHFAAILEQDVRASREAGGEVGVSGCFAGSTREGRLPEDRLT